MVILFARTWLEELIAEWLCVNGYSIGVNIPAGAGEKGGRKEADIIGVMPTNNGIKMVHYEVVHGTSELQKMADRIVEKFSPDRINYIKSYFLRKCDNCVVTYEKYAVVEGCSHNCAKKLRDMLPQDIVVEHIRDFLKNVISLAKEYGARRRTFPDSCWMLNMLRSIAEEGLLT